MQRQSETVEKPGETSVAEPSKAVGGSAEVSWNKMATLFMDSKLRAKVKKGDVMWSRVQANQAFFWAKQIISFVLGVIFGLLPVRGIMGLVAYLGLLMACTSIYQAQLMIPDGIMDSMDALKEGTATSVGTFIATWIVTHTVVHF